ncbi:MAG: pyrroloquinoline quinone biosynthesis peptide chaperone PqqD [Burkholderiales bacterium]|nr:pyrroloquinoline quinone biosynthesis peptide chaperone PqqD [Burkholderiales bacterium]
MSEELRPRLARGFRLQWEPAQNAHVLLYPEGMVKLNTSAGEILKRCDGERSVGQIVAELEQVFARGDLTGGVEAFLEIARRQRWVQ